MGRGGGEDIEEVRSEVSVCGGEREGYRHKIERFTHTHTWGTQSIQDVN